MSKLYDKYLSLRNSEENSNTTLYLFKAGAFFIFLDKDAETVSDILSLKLTHLTENVLKCGFPVSALDKYSKILKHCNYDLKIIDTIQNVSYSSNNYIVNEKTCSLLQTISSICLDSLSVKDAYQLLDNLKSSAINILGGISNEQGKR